MAAIAQTIPGRLGVEKALAFSTGAFGARGALTPALSPRERGLSE